MIFRTIQSENIYRQSIIRRLTSTKFFVVALECHLRQVEHVHQVTKRLNKGLYMIRILPLRVNVELLETIYDSNFVLIFRYGLVVGDSIDLNRLLILKKNAFRAVLGLGYRESCKGLFRDSSMLTLPEYFEDLLNENNTTHIVPYHFPKHSLTLNEKNA